MVSKRKRGGPLTRIFADRIYEAVHDPTPRLRYLVGADAELIVSVYRQKSFEEFEQIMRETLDWKR